MDVDFQALIDEGFICLSDMMNSYHSVKTELEVIATGEIQSNLKDEIIKIEIVLEKGKLFGFVAYSWFGRDEEDDHYDTDSVWFLKKEDAINHAKEWIKECSEEQNNNRDFILEINSCAWFDPSVTNEEIKDLIDYMCMIREKAVLKIWNNCTYGLVGSSDDYNNSDDQLFVVCEENSWEVHANNLLRAVEQHDDEE